ncbi:por secretion system C-terminal sorting domain protein [Cloacibacterium normanense]|uniref:Por secretion system C-terminal sorting domain protein n=2 Tax=Cloacibacterium normanense TaxID=237258 RepID=A0A1E5UEY5_9FLAO|nr:por secretion system C-terminal sorting domain protein [Cloacibacterium normanense]
MSSLAFGQFNDNTPAPFPGIETFTVPANVTSVKAEVWGSGGSGGGSTANNRSGSGGGGGGYTTRTFDVLAGQTITYTVGAGAIANLPGANGNNGNLSNLTHAPSATTLVGNGGGGGNRNSSTGGTGGTATGGTNTSGANGGPGNSGTGGNGGNGGNAPGTGGLGQNNNNGSPGIIPGGGGGGGEYGGSGFTDRAGGAGANGQITLTYISVSNVSPSPVCVGSTITITGTNFTTTGTTTVSINGTPCTSVTVVNSTNITAVVGAGTTSGTVLVTNPNGTNNGRSLTINASPSAIGGGASTVCTASVTPAFTNAVGGGTWSISNGTGSATISSGGIVTGVSVGSATVVYTIGSCSVSTSITVIATPTITTNPSNVSVNGGANTSFTVAASYTPNAYTWQVSTDAGASWTTISNGGVYSNATTATLNITGATLGMSGYLYRASATNNCGTSAYSSNAALTVTYCTPNFTNTDKPRLYINSFQFVGVLNTTVANTSTWASGYQNFTSFTPIAEQPQGTAINILASSGSNRVPRQNGTWKAWVDWNKDGDFNDAGEEVYNMISFTTPSVTFGFIIPAGQAEGNYTLRIGTFSVQGNNFTSCSTTSGYGEMEDYTFKVVTDCPAKVLNVNNVNPFDGERCGAGSVRLSVSGNASAVSYNWYDSIYGGTLLGSGNIYNTPSISSTTTYYVTAVSSTGCETAFRYPVEARVDPNPTVAFSTNKPSICGEDDPTLLVTASGDKYQDVIFEKFDSGLGVFTNEVNGAYTNSIGFWQRRNSPYIPQIAEGYEGLSPAMSSGYFGEGFAMINTDISRGSSGQSILNRMVSNNLDVSGFLNLKVDFDLYNFTIASNFTEGYTLIEYSLNGGTNWNTLDQFIGTRGNPLKWEKFSYNIPGTNFTSTNFKLRFSVYSYAGPFSGGGSGFIEGITTVDNVRIYGFKNITTPFAWSSGTTTLYKPDCVTALGSTLESTVCVKPTPTELEDLNWNLNANATFSNGCPAIGNFTVNNDTKTWRQPGITDWNQGAQWRPTTVPTIAKCVIVRTPVELPSLTTGTHGLARSVIVKSGGKLTIDPKSSLTIQNYLKNEAAASDVLVESDANLLQINNSSVNIGNITVKRNANLKRLDYTYWGSPVAGQNVKAFSAGTLDTRFYVYNESNDYFDGLFIRNLYPDNVTYSLTPTVDKNTHTFIKGKGYAIRASNALSNVLSSIPHSFVGVPNNGLASIPVVKSATGQGYNLISNPYPSNIDFYALYNYGTNSSIIYNTAYFWTNTNYNPKMQGANYPSNLPDGTKITNNYAILNGTGGVSAPYASGTGNNDPIGSPSNCPTCATPNQYIKVGQGFIVKVRDTGSYNLSLENNSGIRNNNSTSVFFNRMANNNQRTNVEKDRFWISLKTPLDFVSPILIGYPQGSSTNYEEDYDAELLIYGGDSFYSNLDNKKLAIQGRGYPFNPSDEVTLGARLGLEGQYEISLGAKEGVFANGQSIYLKDNITGTITNLSEGAYRFVARSGEVNNRFQILYANSTLGSESGQTEKEFIVYQQNHYAMISTAESMKSVKIYDITGKLIFHKKVNKKDFQIDTSSFQSGTYVIEVLTTNRYFTRKIIK